MGAGIYHRRIVGGAEVNNKVKISFLNGYQLFIAIKEKFVSCSLKYIGMRTNELIREIQKLPVQKRIFVIEKSLHSLRKHEEKNQIKKAVDLLWSDYKTDKELTAFSNIDFEDFYEAK